jgi:hypothetical protein
LMRADRASSTPLVVPLADDLRVLLALAHFVFDLVPRLCLHMHSLVPAKGHYVIAQ